MHAIVAGKLLLIPTLVLGLLLQAAAVQAALPCAPETEHAAATSQSTGHEGHAHQAMPDDAHGQSQHEMHGSTTHAMHQTADAHQKMPCCDTDEAATCTTSSCASPAPVMLLTSSIQLISRLLEATAQPVDWLTPYASPADGIFRPPIT
jgi:hypothetical protein